MTDYSAAWQELDLIIQCRQEIRAKQSCEAFAEGRTALSMALDSAWQELDTVRADMLCLEEKHE